MSAGVDRRKTGAGTPGDGSAAAPSPLRFTALVVIVHVLFLPIGGFLIGYALEKGIEYNETGASVLAIAVSVLLIFASHGYLYAKARAAGNAAMKLVTAVLFVISLLTINLVSFPAPVALVWLVGMIIL